MSMKQWCLDEDQQAAQEIPEAGDEQLKVQHLYRQLAQDPLGSALLYDVASVLVRMMPSEPKLPSWQAINLNIKLKRDLIEKFLPRPIACDVDKVKQAVQDLCRSPAEPEPAKKINFREFF